MGVQADDSVKKDDPLVLLPLEVMTKPLELRFQYHFEGDRPTNRLDKVCLFWQLKFTTRLTRTAGILPLTCCRSIEYLRRILCNLLAANTPSSLSEIQLGFHICIH